MHHRVLSPLGALMLIGFVACGSDSSPSPSGSVPSPTHSGQNTDFGPLAVIDGSGGDLALGGTGPIHIGDRCVTMGLSNGDTLLLIWHERTVSWNEDQREITFARPGDSESVTVRDGDTITIGGAPLLSDQPVEQNLVWLATPDASCGGEPWSVTTLRKS